MWSTRDAIVSVVLICLLSQATSQDWTDEGEEAFETNLKEEELTIVDKTDFENRYGGKHPIKPSGPISSSWQHMSYGQTGWEDDRYAMDDLLLVPDHGLSRHKRQASADDVQYSGTDNPCDTNDTLCSNPGEMCVFNPDLSDGYECLCQDDYEKQGNSCIAIPESQTLYLTSGLQHPYDPDFSNQSSILYIDFTNNSQEAFAQEFTGLDGYKTLRAIDLRNDNGSTTVVYIIYFLMNVTDLVTNSVASRVLVMEGKKGIQIGDQSLSFRGYTGIFSTLADTNTVNDAVDWCSSPTLFTCETANTYCKDGGVPLRYSCVCSDDFVDVNGECVSKNVAQLDLYPYGTAEDDSKMDRSDDGTQKIPVVDGFPFGDKLSYDIFIGINGLISFDTANRGVSFALTDTRAMFCPYLTDIDTLGALSEGEVFYHLYTNRTAKPSVFSKADSEMRQFLQVTNFNTKIMIVVTWSKVSPRWTTEPQKQQVTFQAVMVSDGTKSYGLVVYKTGSINWTYMPTRPLIIGVSKGKGDPAKVELVSNTSQAFNGLDKLAGNTGRRGTWLYELGEAYSANMDCVAWYTENSRLRFWYSFMSWILPWCPCTTVSLRRSIWIFHRRVGDALCFRLSLGMSFRFYPFGQECCYRWTGRSRWGTQVRTMPDAGSLMTSNPAFRHLRALHYQDDLLPHDLCCRQADPGYCQFYYQLRPVGICSLFPDFGVSFMLGDPHVLTLDGKEYTFNGWGEYTMVTLQNENVTFVLQGRTEKAISDNGTLINATVFTAFAATDGNVNISVTMDVNRTSMIIFADNKDYTLQFEQNEEMMVEEEGYTLLRENNSLVASFPSQISLTITPGIKLLDISVSLPGSVRNISKGLLGDFNGNPDDDFVLPNGTVLSPNMTEREIFEQFGQTWAITPSESIFRYERRRGPADYQHPEFVPIFLDEASPEQRAAAETECGSTTNLACIYDYIATGSKAVAQATLTAKNTADDTEANLQNTAPEVTSNSSVTVHPGETVTLKLVGTDNDNDSVTYFAADDASGSFTLNNATGEVTYDVDASNKTDKLQFYVVDSKNAASPVTNIEVVFCPTCSGHGQCDVTRPRPALSSETYRYASCICLPWYEGDDCEKDFDGCAEDPCIVGQNCTDVPAEIQQATNQTYNCSACPVGYSIFDEKCTDIDECNSTSTNDCAQICINTDGSYRCTCEDGYRLSSDDRSCDDINECAEKISKCQQICINTVGSYNCSCEPGYYLDPSNNGTCHEEQATAATCQSLNCTGGCRIVNSSVPECFCYPGYKVNATDPTLCDDEDECNDGICSQECSNSPGSFSCSCYVGYKLSSDTVTCEACTGLNYGKDCSQLCECNGRSSTCDPVTGCVCPAGWRGEQCQNDVNECQESPGLCGQTLEKCVNTDGSYRCQCLEGYRRSSANAQCEDIDECGDEYTGTTCEGLQVCHNTVGSFYCECQTGYQMKDGNCTDIDECDNGVAKCEQLCINNPGSFTCDCNLGYILAADRTNCDTAEDVCANSLDCSQFCTLDDDNKPYCFCKAGYRLGSDDQTCHDIDECEQGLADCSNFCTNEPGSFVCSCPVGTRLHNDKRTCRTCETGTFGAECKEECNCGVGANNCDPATGCNCTSGWTGSKCDQDINECAIVSITTECIAQNAQCENYPGGYRCACATGYARKTNTSNLCEDIDECLSGPCGQQCENTPGSYRCLCNAGFTLDTKTNLCKDDDECSLVSTNRCTQKCVNTVGSYRCACDQAGFILENDGFTCKAKTECSTPNVCASTGNGGCSVNGTGHDVCFCFSGYELDASNNCSLEERDWCGEANCQMSCVNTTDKPYFQCGCPAGFELNDDKRTCRECTPERWGDACANQCTCDLQNSQQCAKENGTCVCKTGWEGDNCTQDIDECNNSALFSCVNYSQCENIDGGYICMCLPGFFKADDGNCTECPEGFYNECNTECSCSKLNTQSCNKLNGSCTCKEGWEGTDCETDTDECDVVSPTHDCTGAHELCVNKDGTFDCVCETGYLYNTSKHCVDRDECLDRSHNCSHTCVNFEGGFNCSCPTGFEGDVYNCTECTEGTYGEGCSSNCTCNTEGTVSCDNVNGTCYCKPGMKGDYCQDDIDECSADSNLCGPHSNCTNFEGGHNCTCHPGYSNTSINGNCTECAEGTYGMNCSSSCTCDATGTDSCDHVNGTCYCKPGMEGDECQTDTDECSTDPDPCGQNSNCTNVVGGYNCTCNHGYIDINSDGDCTECAEGMYGVNCSSSCTCNATGTDSCDHINGTCYCRPGVEGDDCQTDIDECSVDPDRCGPNSNCTNFFGGYNCTCYPGYGKTSSDGNCTDVNECDTNNGGCQQLCNNTQGSFECSCRDGYRLASDGLNCHELQNVAFGLTIEIVITNLSNILSDTSSADYMRLEAEVKQQIFAELNKTVQGLLDVIIKKLTEGSLEVDAEAELNKNAAPDVAATMANALVDLQSTNFNISGQQGNVSAVIVNNQTVTDKCTAYTIITPCETDAECRLDSETGQPTCVALSQGDYKLIIGLAVGIPLFFITVIIIAVLVYIHIKGRREKSLQGDYEDEQSQLSAVFSRKIATRGVWKAGGLYSPDTLSSASSDDDKHRSRMRGLQRPEFDTSPWNDMNKRATDAEARPSNFSWDFLYNQLPPPEQPFSIRRPQVQVKPNPTYDNANDSHI